MCEKKKSVERTHLKINHTYDTKPETYFFPKNQNIPVCVAHDVVPQLSSIGIALMRIAT